MILWVRVFCDYVAIHKIGGHTCNLGELPPVLSEEEAVALLRHSLSR